MKTLPIILVVALFIGVWQRRAITAVRAERAQLREMVQPVVNSPDELPLDASGGKRSADSEEATAANDSTAIEEILDVVMKLERKEGNPDAYLPRLMALLGKLSSAGRERLFAELDSESLGQVAASVRFLAIQSLVSTDPQEAAEMTVAWQRQLMKNGPVSADSPATMAMALTFRTWAKKDMESALAWIEKVRLDGLLPVLPELDGLIALAKAEAGPKHALQAIAESDPDVQERIIHESVESLTTPEARLEFAEAYLQEIQADETLSELQPQVASHLLGEVFRHPEPNLKEADALLDRLALTDPQVAASAFFGQINESTAARLDWLRDRFKGDAKLGRAIEDTMRHWAASDHRAAAQWLQAQPASEDRDLGIVGFARTVAMKEPESAVDWALTIGDPNRREQALLKVEQIWQGQDAEAAEAYLRAKGVRD